MSESTLQVPPTDPDAIPATGVVSGVEEDDTDSMSIVLIGLVSTVLVLASALGVTAMFEWYKGKLVGEKVTAAVYSEAESALREQDLALKGAARKNDKLPGKYIIPINQAMSLVVSELQNGELQNEQKDSDE